MHRVRNTTCDIIILLSVGLGIKRFLNVFLNRWGRIAILTALGDYRPSDSKEAEHIVERVIPQFQHVNGSVVLSAIKVIE